MCVCGRAHYIRDMNNAYENICKLKKIMDISYYFTKCYSDLVALTGTEGY